MGSRANCLSACHGHCCIGFVKWCQCADCALWAMTPYVQLKSISLTALWPVMYAQLAVPWGTWRTRGCPNVARQYVHGTQSMANCIPTEEPIASNRRLIPKADNLMKNRTLWRMSSSGIWRREALVRTDVSGNISPPSSGGKVTASCYILLTSFLARWFFTLMAEAKISTETSDHTKTTPRSIPEDCSLHSHRRQNLKSYMKMLKPE
jgi:hypothetical protein